MSDTPNTRFALYEIGGDSQTMVPPGRRRLKYPFKGIFALPWGCSVRNGDREWKLLRLLANSANNQVKGARVRLKILARPVSSRDDCELQ